MDHFLKFLVVGGIGFGINTVILVAGVRHGLRPSLAGPAGAELAILSNFLLNNFWTFSDRRITSWSAVPEKFITFNILSFGSVLIQFAFLKIGEKIFTLEKFKEPILNHSFFNSLPGVKQIITIKIIKKLADKFSAYMIFYMAGVGVGLVVNFIIYSQLIWK